MSRHADLLTDLAGFAGLYLAAAGAGLGLAWGGVWWLAVGVLGLAILGAAVWRERVRDRRGAGR